MPSFESLKNTRYRHAVPFQPDTNGKLIFGGMRQRPIGMATEIVKHVLKEGDRLDLLALHYYNDPRLWWRILDANPNIFCGLDITISKTESQQGWIGKSIAIPRATES